jgi:NAD(P)-dependent dehydrogenase (short-subunit alcohol dehydrogenase family)
VERRRLRSSKAGIAQVEADLGPIEVVVANAGITRDAMFHRMTPEQWNEVIDTNLTGVFNTVHPVWPGMRERKFGRVIVISSINGQKGQAGQVNYAATKAGDLGIVKSLAQEGARAGITANAICPGYIGTEMVRAIPEDVLNSKIIRRSRRPSGRARGNRALRGVPGVRRCGLHQRVDDLGQRGAVLRLIAQGRHAKGRGVTPAFFRCGCAFGLSGGTAPRRTSRSSWRIPRALAAIRTRISGFVRSFPCLASFRSVAPLMRI